MFSPIRNDPTNRPYDALLEMVLLQETLSKNAVAIRDEVIGVCGGGQVLVWNWDNTSWPPSFAMIRQGNTLYLLATGTETFPQLWGDIVGCYGVPYPGDRCDVHTFFLQSWQTLRNMVVNNLPTDWRNCTFRFCGHSLGAAVLFLGALEWKRDNPTIRVEVLNIAMPKSLTSGYTGPLPDVCVFVASPDDCITMLPPTDFIVRALDGLGIWPSSFFGYWRHYGDGLALTAGGELVALNPGDLDIAEKFIFMGPTVIYHYRSRYLQSIALGWTTHRRVGQGLALIPIELALRATPRNQTLVNNIQANRFISIPDANVHLFNGTPEGPLTPQNINFTNAVAGKITAAYAANGIFTAPHAGAIDMASKITLFMYVNQAGFSESYYDQANDAGAYTPQKLANFMFWRMQICGRQTVWNYIRISTVGTSRTVKILVPSDFDNVLTSDGLQVPLGGMSGGGPLGPQSISDFGGTALLVRKYAGLKFSRIFLRGIPDAVVDAGGLYKPFAKFRGDFDSYVFHVKALQWSWRGVSGNVNPPAAITNCVQGPGLQATFTLGTNLFNVGDIGKTVVVRVSRQKNPGNLNGTRTVVVATVNSCITTQNLPVVGFLAGNGKMTYSTQGYNLITDMKVERVVAKRPGRPFGLYHGR